MVYNTNKDLRKVIVEKSRIGWIYEPFIQMDKSSRRPTIECILTMNREASNNGIDGDQRQMNPYLLLEYIGLNNSIFYTPAQ